MIELEKLDYEGNLLFAQKYTKRAAAAMLESYGTYPQSDKIRWRLKAAAVKAKKSKNEED